MKFPDPMALPPDLEARLSPELREWLRKFEEATDDMPREQLEIVFEKLVQLEKRMRQ